MKRSLALLVLSSMFGAISASADESRAEQVFKEGRALMIAGRFAEACPKLEESQRLEPKGGTQLNVAACHERLGKIATAWAEFHDAVVAARTDGHAERERLAQQRVDALEPRLPWLTITVAEGAAGRDLTIEIDGAAILPVAIGKDMPVDPGEHRISATLAGEVVWETTLVFKEATRQSVLVPAPPPKAPRAPPEPPDARDLPPPPPPSIEREPPAPVEPPAVKPASTGLHFIFELGAFAGFMSGDMNDARLNVPEDSLRFSKQTSGGSESATCGSIRCTYSLSTQGGFVSGPSGFAGIAWNDSTQLGLRIFGGPRAGGGGLFVIGPSISAHLWGPIWAGGSLFLGAAGQSGNGTVTPESPYRDDSGQDVRPSMSQSLGLSFGASAELSFAVIERPSGSLRVQLLPLFLVGSSGAALSLPFGLAYRWH
ncbi:MAG: hypothetical protein ABJE95_01840 [Byssovorax sp.]